MDVALATCANLPEPDPDAAPLVAALGEAGLSAAVLAWDDPGVDWSSARMTLLRSTWNYPLRPQAFLAWADSTDRVSRLPISPAGPSKPSAPTSTSGCCTRASTWRPAAGDPVVMELELIEPSLYFAQGPRALERLVRAIRARLDLAS